MASLSVTHSRVTGAAANPNVLVDGPAWDAEHVVIGPDYATRAELAAAYVAASLLYVRTGGYTTAGVGGALHKRALSQPSHAGKVQSADGAWWEIADDVLSPAMFGAMGDTTNGTNGTDDTTALQNWISTCEALGRPGRAGVEAYRITGTLFVGATNPVDIKGTIVNTTAGTELTATTLWCNFANGVNGVSVGSTGSTRQQGIRFGGFYIKRVTQETAAGLSAGRVPLGGVGIIYRGVVAGRFDDITTDGFDFGSWVTETTTSGVTSGCIFNNCRSENSTSCGDLWSAAIECRIIGGKSGTAPYCAKLLDAPSGTNSPNGNVWIGRTFIAGTGTPATNNLYSSGSAFFNVFDACAFEDATGQNIYCVGGASVGNGTSLNVELVSPWCNNGDGSAYFEDCNFAVTNIRGNSGGSATNAGITAKRVSATKSFLVGTISGGLVPYGAIAGLSVIDWDGLVSTGVLYVDAQALSLPAVNLDTNARNCVITGNRFRTAHATGYVNTSTTNRIAGNILSTGSAIDTQGVAVGLRSTTVLTNMTPGNQIHDVSANASDLLARWSANGGSPQSLFFKSRGAAIGARTVVQSTDELGRIRWIGDDGANDIVGAEIIAVVDATPGTNDMPTRLDFWTTPDGSNTTVKRLELDNAGNVTLGTAALATNATNGFLYIPTCAGTPTGVPTTKTGRAPMVYDTTNHKFWIYDTAWKGVVLT